MAATPALPPDSVEQIRQFNRYYTRQLGLLQATLLDSPFTLPEARLLFEIAHQGETTARELADALGLDAGYLSRLLKSLQRRRLIQRTTSQRDARQRVIRLAQRGRQAFAELDARSREQLSALLQPLNGEQQQHLTAAMQAIRNLLDASSSQRRGAVTLRSHRPGDIGWIIHRHGVLYEREYGWDASFEGLVAVILGEFEQHHDPQRERSWIAEVDGRFAGCVFLVEESDSVARLRCLLVEPAARGLGLGTRLVEECIAFAGAAGYGKIVLWTNSVLDAARRIYQRTGFRLVDEQPYAGFGKQLISQTWELELAER